MGSFYTNVTLVGADADAAAAALHDQGTTAWIGTWPQGSVVFDELGDQQGGNHIAVAQQLSTKLACKALAALVHDDDFLILTLFDGGRRVGQWNSFPDYFDEALFEDEDDESFPDGNSLDAANLAATFGAPEHTERLEALMAEEHVFATDLHASVVELLGLPDAAVGTGFNYLELGELPDDADAGQLRRL